MHNQVLWCTLWCASTPPACVLWDIDVCISIRELPHGLRTWQGDSERPCQMSYPLTTKINSHFLFFPSSAWHWLSETQMILPSVFTTRPSPHCILLLHCPCIAISFFFVFHICLTSSLAQLNFHFQTVGFIQNVKHYNKLKQFKFKYVWVFKFPGKGRGRRGKVKEEIQCVDLECVLSYY